MLSRSIIGGIMVVGGAITPLWAFAAPGDDIYDAALKEFMRGDHITAMGLLADVQARDHVKSQMLLGYILDAAEMNEQAAAIYQRWADQGVAEAERELSGMYANGEGVALDANMAQKLMLRAAEGGDVDAMLALSQAYKHAGLGLPIDPVASQMWLEKSAKQGHPTAIHELQQLQQGTEDKANAKSAKSQEKKDQESKPKRMTLEMIIERESRQRAK